jgi:hypothetical protein
MAGSGMASLRADWDEKRDVGFVTDFWWGLSGVREGVGGVGE